jgi:hypothetical protein
MNFAPFTPLPHNAILSLGGFSMVKPLEWNRYLDSTLRERYPLYRQEQDSGPAGDGSRLENGCVLQSLEQYLLEIFGTAIPADNLFKVFNHDGQGIAVDKMLEAISAVIEPLGFEVERVLVADDALREGLGWAERVASLADAGDFDGKAGICMINVRPGYSHAFYWNKMQAGKFYKEQFRMAVLIKRQDGSLPAPLYAHVSLGTYCQLLGGYVDKRFSSGPASQSLRAEVIALSRYAHNARYRNGRCFQENVDRRLDTILRMLNEQLPEEGNMGEAGDDECIREAGKWMRLLIRAT